MDKAPARLGTEAVGLDGTATAGESKAFVKHQATNTGSDGMTYINFASFGFCSEGVN
jgi:hypothetical protein